MSSDQWSHHYEDDTPLQDKRPFGSGLKRQRVVFVPASSGSLSTTEAPGPSESSKSVADMYLSIVLPKEPSRDAAPTQKTDEDSTPPQICEVCNLPIKEGSPAMGKTASTGRPHETSLAHQLCLEHSHPPSALDRSRMGLGVLQSQGWDPDSRAGLGASEQGIQYPIKAKQKDNRLGIGVKVPKDVTLQKKEKVQRLDAKQARKQAALDKKKMERLRRHMYGNPDVEKYLGDG
ncbi:hypothetical protein GGR56DRAFT_340480 [Xylariaceae sp. FL0804]|nr:hypothetical protein GGR56DRAFT_340480 [Xylariaceae sp. FL0804]